MIMQEKNIFGVTFYPMKNEYIWSNYSTMFFFSQKSKISVVFTLEPDLHLLNK